jgi:hypothetical protein
LNMFWWSWMIVFWETFISGFFLSVDGVLALWFQTRFWSVNLNVRICLLDFPSSRVTKGLQGAISRT